MGCIQHEAIIVTGWQQEQLKDIRNKAVELFSRYSGIDEHGDLEEESNLNCVSEIVGTGMNQYMSFMVAPDGSKEAWLMSDKFDEKRKEFVEYLKTNYYSDGSASFSWVWVSYGETGRRVKKSNCKNLY